MRPAAVPLTPSPDVALGALIAGAVLPVVVLASTDDCAPCTLIKPSPRKFAVEFSDAMILVEVTRETAPGFVAAQRFDGYPCVLTFREGRRVACETGYSGPEETRAMLIAALGLEAGGPPTAADLAFQTAIADADAQVDALMQAASDALAPEIEAVTPQIEAVERRARMDRSSGRLTAGEAQARRLAALKALYAPFQHKVDALRSAQDEAMRVYEARMDDALRSFTQAQAASGSRIVCDPDGAVCRIVSKAIWRRQSATHSDN